MATTTIQIRRMLIRARLMAADVSIRVAGVTRDGYLVTTQQCVDYQLSQGNLLYAVDGNWHHRTTWRGSSMVKGRTIVRYYKPLKAVAV